MTGVVYPTADMKAVRTYYGLYLAARLSAWWGRNWARWGKSAQEGYKAGWWAAIEWLLNLQHSFDELTQGQQLAELRKSTGSIYAPLFTADPSIDATCPACDQSVVIKIDGACPECQYTFTEVD